MISRRNYIVMSVMMFVLLFLFQATKILQDNKDSHYTNDYFNEEYKQDPKEAYSDFDSSTYILGESAVAFVGKRYGELYRMVDQWCTYTKRELAVYDSLESVELEDLKEASFLIWDMKLLSYARDLERLEKLTQTGTNVILCNMPKGQEFSKYMRFAEYCGINHVVSIDTVVQTVKTYDGFLLGGEEVFSLAEEGKTSGEYVPWYALGQGTEIFIVGYPGQNVDSNDDYLPLVWRSKKGKSFLYCINAPFTSDETALGLFSAIAADAEPYSLYPVVNGQSVSVLQFPEFSGERDEILRKIYERTEKELYRDIIMPGLISYISESGSKLTAFMTPQNDYTDRSEPVGDMYSFYMQQLYSEKSEVGLSMSLKSDVTMEEKATRDQAFYKKQEDRYVFGAAYVDGTVEAGQLVRSGYFKNITTMAMPKDTSQNLVTYYNQNITSQAVTADGFHLSGRDRLRIKSIETALAYSNVAIDMEKVVNPKDEDSQWEKLFTAFTGNMKTYWAPYEVFDKTTLSENDRRIRNLLGVSYQHSLEKNVLKIKQAQYADNTWYILRTHGKRIAKITGGSYVQIEKDAYLLNLSKNKVRITLEEDLPKQLLIY